MDYAELHCLSSFSFLRGASHPEELVRQAGVLGYSALAITDECSVAGAVRAHLAAREHGPRLIVGSELRLADGPPLVLLACDRDGYGNLCEILTRGRRAAAKGAYRLSRDDLTDRAGGCLALVGEGERRELQELDWVAEAFPGRAWIAATVRRDGRDRARMARIETLAGATGMPMVAAGGVRMHVRERRRLHDVLTAIRLGTTVEDAGLALAASAEAAMRSRRTLQRLYPPALLRETLRVAERCTFSLDEIRYEYPEELVPTGHTATSHLRALTMTGMQERWPHGTPQRVRDQVERELSLIAELRYEAYFLTVHDLVHFARKRGILCQGRGSAANSAVCFCLGITAVDPARMNLLFERFISRERNEPPDIDVDFEHDRREEVMQYVFDRYGRHRAALAATVITYRARSAVRDVGKALGLSLEQVDRLAGNLSWWDGTRVEAERLREVGFDPRHPRMQRLLALTAELIGFPRHLSQHTGGFVIARDRLSRMVPIENAAMPGRTVIQWDKDDLDALGLLKVDCLALGMLSAIRRSFDLLRHHRGQEITLAEVPAEAPEVYEMVRHADTVGVFQIESRAQMAMLPRLAPANFYDLVIEVAIVRPGPIQGDMVHPYLRRRQGLEPVDYPSEEVRAVLERTLGVPIFQEQVIQLATVAAGFTPGEADGLRRSMAAWRRRGGMEHYERRLIEGMRARGYDEAFAHRIYRQILGFGEYGFPESHSASFALLVYVSAWLKCFEPAVFTCALLNSQPMGFYAPAQLIADARRHGVGVRPVDVNASDHDCTLEPDHGRIRFPWENAPPAARPADQPAIRLGLRMVTGLSTDGARRLVRARGESPFRSVGELARRARLSRRDLEHLAAADALAGIAGHRHQGHWQSQGVEPPAPLLADTETAEATPLLRRPSEAEEIVADYAGTGLTLRRHPLALLRARLHARGLSSAAAVGDVPHGARVATAGLVITRQRPGSSNNVTFLTLEDETGSINIIAWKNITHRFRRAALSARLLAVHGEVQREGEVQHVIAERLQDLSPLLGQLATRSRDFR